MIERLERWADDPEVRAIAVTGMGGQGKTSLIGQWLRKKGGAAGRRTGLLFRWSFYNNRDVGSLIEGLLAYGLPVAACEARTREVRPVTRVLTMLRSRPVVLVLDGLEVLQGGPRSATYGELLQDDLRELLDGICRDSGGGLVVLTSRFTFNDLHPYLGDALRSLDLDRLSGDEGAALLLRCGVRGLESDRRDVSERLDGHPLALRIFAATLATQAHGDLTRLCQVVFTSEHLSDEDDFERKLKRLLAFYETNIPPERAVLLGIVAMFRSPVGAATILRLARGLPKAQDVLERHDDPALDAHLRALVREHLLLREPGEQGEAGYTCHPVLRDHFRAVLLGKDPQMATKAAGMLTDQPSRVRAKSIEETEPVLVAIEPLLEAGDFQQANELYSARLYDGRLFRWLPASYDGMLCAAGFVEPSARRVQCKRALDATRLSFYLNEVGFFAMYAGELTRAAAFYRDDENLNRKLDSKHRLSIGLGQQSKLLVSFGRLRDAEVRAREALALAREVSYANEERKFLARLGNTLARSGQLVEAMATFEAANTWSGPSTQGKQSCMRCAAYIGRTCSSVSARPIAPAV